MAGESRQTQVVGVVNRIGSDSAIKVFELTDTVLAVTAGWAFLQPHGSTMMRNISSLIEDFKPTIAASSGVQAIATLLWPVRCMLSRKGRPYHLSRCWQIGKKFRSCSDTEGTCNEALSCYLIFVFCGVLCPRGFCIRRGRTGPRAGSSTQGTHSNG